ncbi:MAG TPA: polysaccharide deacetylase family protein [Conexibacter sp.]|jgi:peptidoglycan/xylan/chitin deacetylase (PgdA/CDA1 family)|nr:polysaccharide deacetylase family protein [Conexibacter sp.]
MRVIDLIRGPSRPTQVQLRHRRRRAGGLAVVAGAALLLGMVVGAGSRGGTDDLRGAATQVGWYGHLRALAGAGRRSLDFEQRARESRAIDRTLATTPFVRLAGQQHRLLALTFDDGPSAYTDRLIDELQQLHVPATFFVVGYQLSQFAPQLQREVDLGLTVGDHTVDHPNLTQLSAKDQRSQIVDDATKIRSYGAPYPRLFRPPYGAYDRTTHALLARQRMLSVLWSIDSRDYTRPGVDAIVQNVVGNAQPGRIVLMHDGGGDRTQTLAAVPRIVQELRRQGYRFVSVPRLLLENPPPQQQELPSGFNSAGAG